MRIRLSVLGLLGAAGAVACAATLLGWLGRFSWILDLFSHFRLQYLLGLGLAGVVFLAARRLKTAALFFAFASINLCVLAPFYFGGGGRGVVDGSVRPLRAMLINVNSRLGDKDRVRQVIHETDPDFVVLEEITSRWLLDLRWLLDSHPHSCVQTREDNFGIGLFSKMPLDEGKIVSIGEIGVPSILATIATDQGQLRVVATHPPPPAGGEYSRWRNDQLDRLPDHIRSPLPLILLGDLNVTPWNHHFKRLIERTGLIDSSRGRGIGPTWPTYNPFLLIPIDHCLHSAEITVVEKYNGEGVGSDHFPVIVDFVIGARPLAPGTVPREAPARQSIRDGDR